MTILSSQRYLDEEIVEEKKAQIAVESVVLIPCSYVGYLDGEEYAIVVDKHHTMAAAKELGIIVKFDVTEDSEKLTGDALLEARWIDSAYYDVETGMDVF